MSGRLLINSVLLGVGLAMDAFSVSVANAMREPSMKRRKALVIAGTFGGFQCLMPLIGWLCVRTVIEAFRVFESFVPWIALILLVFIGGKMILEGVRGEEEDVAVRVGPGGLLVQGIATSIDALSTGFAIAEYSAVMALTASVIIGTVTFLICIAGILIGRKFGTLQSSRATIVGGVILICVGLEICFF